MKKIEFLKRMIPLGISASMILSGISVTDHGRTFSVVSAEQSQQEYATGYVAADNVKTFDPDTIDPEILNEDYPESYIFGNVPIVGTARESISYTDNPYITPVKDQGSDGTCWAHASINEYEAMVLTHLGLSSEEYYEKYGEYLDLSENHLRFATSPDGNNIYVPFSRHSFDEGAGFQDALPYFIGGREGVSGPVYEKDDPYRIDYEQARDISETLSFANKAGFYPTHTKEYGSISPSTFDGRKALPAFLSVIKNDVLRSGAVTINYTNAADQFSDCEYGCTYYVTDGIKGDSHAVSVVGWDDSIPASAFKTKPAARHTTQCQCRGKRSGTRHGIDFNAFFVAQCRQILTGVGDCRHTGIGHKRTGFTA